MRGHNWKILSVSLLIFSLLTGLGVPAVLKAEEVTPSSETIGQFTGYYTKITRSAWGDTKECDNFVALDGHNGLINYYIDKVERGNSVQSLDEDGNLLINLDFDGTSSDIINRIVNSTELSPITLKLQKKVEIGQGTIVCHSFFKILDADTVNPSVKPQSRPLPRPTTDRPMKPDLGTGVTPSTDASIGGAGNPDLNGDGIVGYADMRILLSQWGPCRVNAEGYHCRGDLDFDGEVDVEDLVALITAWTDEVPEGGMDELGRIPERCQAIQSPALQRRCFMAVAQEGEVKSKERRILPSLQNKLRDRMTDDSLRERNRQVIESRVKNYLRHWTNMLSKMAAAIERLERLALRIESRIEKLEAQGVSLEDAKRRLAEARTSLEEARGELKNLSATYEDVLEADDLKGGFAKMRERVLSVRESIKDTHWLLVSAVELIKQAGSSSN